MVCHPGIQILSLEGSRFFEIGLAWRTRVFENSNWLRVKYGFSFQFNGLKPTDNRYFVEDGEMTVLETYPLNSINQNSEWITWFFPCILNLDLQINPKQTGVTGSQQKRNLSIGLGGFRWL
jgi:hypothetical protein